MLLRNNLSSVVTIASCMVFSMIFLQLGIASALEDKYYFTAYPQHNLQVEEGEQQVLHCDVNDRRNMAFSWYIDGEAVVDTTRRYQQARDLIISSVSRQLDSGWFYCEAINTATHEGIQSTSAKLNITCKCYFLHCCIGFSHVTTMLFYGIKTSYSRWLSILYGVLLLSKFHIPCTCKFCMLH